MISYTACSMALSMYSASIHNLPPQIYNNLTSAARMCSKRQRGCMIADFHDAWVGEDPWSIASLRSLRARANETGGKGGTSETMASMAWITLIANTESSGELPTGGDSRSLHH